MCKREGERGRRGRKEKHRGGQDEGKGMGQGERLRENIHLKFSPSAGLHSYIIGALAL